ncbi:MAG: adenylate/guanylate cyclase domain-containing protein, partial [Terriglobales bacterium]
LMAADEDATVAALDAARAVFKARIEGNQGRIIDMAGDSVLAVFETATGAVTAALEIQKELNSMADTVAENRRMHFRVGVHLGDVIEKADGTIYGDGVNIAARLQALAEPGGVSVSGVVQEAVRDHMWAVFEDLGEHEVKNMARPVHVYRVDFGVQGATAGAAAKFLRAARRLGWRIWAPAALVLAVAMGAWIVTADSAKDARVSLASLFGQKPSQASSARASIAVMPFANQSGDAKRDYFSDGVTEDIISALGRFSGVMVMSRNAVQAYKGRAMTSAEISRELGVRYIAQGSVREADGKLRVAVELSDAGKGVQLWSERLEGAGAEVFVIQDRIVKNIVGALAVKLTRIEQE